MFTSTASGRGCIFYAPLLLLLLSSQVCAREMKSLPDIDLDDNIKKLFCGRTGHLCMHKKPSTLHLHHSITGPPPNLHAIPASYLNESDAPKSRPAEEQAEMKKKNDAAVLIIG